MDKLNFQIENNQTNENYQDISSNNINLNSQIIPSLVKNPSNQS
jgi:hypothetical protein